jgi:hypothetical protein
LCFDGCPSWRLAVERLEAAVEAVTEPSCRLYQTPAGPRGVPAVEAIAAALAGRLSV